ncbi:Lysosomal acid phosphatase [Toxocara canis]|uniref:acid phosphatase n=1 Tax=Toxocara canis TaxID=6265 RepID=A0A0B2VUH2_TOXCA|nr:Lysosomal acid phosphatase [Toxocara canis]
MVFVLVLFSLLLCFTAFAQNQLLLVHVVWQDGDHVPTRICKNDKNTWSGQLGQLTAKGMQQHRILGAFLFKKYGIDSSFFNETYTPSQIYVRSADFNRTITSATSNMVGMYYNRNGDIPGLDYPAENGWPNGYVPIPIHMIQQSVDHLLNPDSECPRHQYLMNVLRRSNEFKLLDQQKQIYVRSADFNRTITSATSNMVGMYYNRNGDIPGLDYPAENGWPNGYVPIPIHMIQQSVDHLLNPDSECPRHQYLMNVLRRSNEFKLLDQQEQSFLTNVSAVCGDSISLLDTTFVASSYRREQLHGKKPIFTQDEYNRLDSIESLVVDYINGRRVSNTDGINLSVELPKVRAGTLLWEIINRMDSKAMCLDRGDTAEGECKYLNNLRYYAYSVTEDMLDALFVTLGVQLSLRDKRNSDASALAFELWKTLQGTYQIKVFHVGNSAINITMLSSQISGHEDLKPSAEYCPLQIFKERSMPYYPGNIEQLCNQVPADWKPTNSAQLATQAMRRHATVRRSKAARQLVFLQAVWRHGDRNPKGICPNDNNTESTWRKGFGQLTPLGMEQHRLLGSVIYDEYVSKYKFLSPAYNAAEMYIRSTDINRTVTSAMANFIGMYYNRSNGENDFPNEAGWPYGFIPAPIHTVDDATDYIGDPHVDCPRKTDLVDLTMQMPEVIDFKKQNEDFLQNMSTICGKRLDVMGVSMPTDTWFVEKEHNRDRIFTEEQYKRLDHINFFADNVYVGLLNTSEYDGYNLRVELATLSGGCILWDIIDHMNQKRGSTLNALLAALEAKSVHPNGELPFASAIIFELWRNENGNFEVVVRLRDESLGVTLKTITRSVGGCEVSDACSWETFKKRSQPFNPGDIKQLCNKRAYPSTTIPQPVSTTTGLPTTSSTTRVLPSPLIGENFFSFESPIRR